MDMLLPGTTETPMKATKTLFGGLNITVGHAGRIFASSIIPLLLLLARPVVLEAEDYLHTTNNGTITITKYTGLSGVVTIPSTINGLPVTTIGNYAFSRCTSITSVT